MIEYIFILRYIPCYLETILVCALFYKYFNVSIGVVVVDEGIKVRQAGLEVRHDAGGCQK